MPNINQLTKILALIGTVFVWLTILAPFIVSLLAFGRSRRLRFDYLMPGELFPLVLLGGALLLWAAVRAGTPRRLIAWPLAIMVLAMVGSQALAVVTGLASGEVSPEGSFWWPVVMVSIALYILMVVVMGVGGICLLRDLKRPSQPGPAE